MPTVLLVICLGLSSCSSNSDSDTDLESESKFDSQVNECTQEEITDGTAWITGQLDAFASAYSTLALVSAAGSDFFTNTVAALAVR